MIYMVAITSTGGLVNDALVVPFTNAEAITDAGYVLALNTDGKVALCGAGAKPIGISFKSTYNEASGSTETDVKVGVITLRPGTIVNVRLLATNAAIDENDLLETTAGGTVDLKSGAGYIVGVALEARGANAGGTAATAYIKCMLMPEYFAA